MFAWRADDVGEKTADYFYPISITEKELILEKCMGIGVDGVCSIASDLAIITVDYVAEKMSLIGNSLESVRVSTNKHLMRRCFELNKDPSPHSIEISSANQLRGVKLDYPLIVKPVDRSGSRGITKVYDFEQLESAVENARQLSFEKMVLVEEFVNGQEYSVEYLSWEGNHEFIALTKKYTTGAPDYIETAHLEPAPVDPATLSTILNAVVHALNSLGIRYGASHSELKVSDRGEIKFIEIGGRMGEDKIGSSLVGLSTGYDYIGAVLDVSMGIKPEYRKTKNLSSAIRFVLDEEDLKVLDYIKKNNPGILVEENIKEITGRKVNNSSSRFGYYVLAAEKPEDMERFMPGSNLCQMDNDK